MELYRLRSKKVRIVGMKECGSKKKVGNVPPVRRKRKNSRYERVRERKKKSETYRLRSKKVRIVGVRVCGSRKKVGNVPLGKRKGENSRHERKNVGFLPPERNMKKFENMY